MSGKIPVLFFVFLSFFSINAQKNQSKPAPKPKLVVGLVVDQMRWDFLYRYESKYGNGGFKRLMREGYNLNNVMIDYVPTVTALGHTAIYTGSVPAIHGIAGNDWTDRKTGKNVYCTTDTEVKGIGASSEKIGAHSPHNLWSTTITDQLGISTNFRSKVVGVSLKDRASILPAGHNPTGAFWFDEGTGHFITSSYYMSDLPQWLKNFNAQNWGEKLVADGWDTSLPIDRYTESTADDVPWENLLGSAKTPTFPYRSLAADYAKKKGIIRTTPFGNTLTLKVAEAAIDGYQMGKNADTDFLAVNIASTDYVGHSFGPNSIEVQDTYLRLDKDLENFFIMLDKKVGKGNYLVFLSADHGGAHSLGYMEANKMLTGLFDDGLQKNLEEELEAKFAHEKIIWGIDNYQIFLNRDLIEKNNLDEEDIKEFLIKRLNRDKRVLYAVDLAEVASAAIPEPIKSRIINGYNWQRSGDIQIISHDGMLPNYAKKGTTHSVWNSYDSHIPLIFMGAGVKQGQSSKPYHMTDIAPTLAQILKIENPSGSIGQPIAEVLAD
ncbi:alkaline phosphatase family protein [Chryseobacterium sp. 6424]|uniref:alkaline phosphatase PafA n=1 Tax=Chryseobacterium sp. 6424 TaxID=2039166 RepID=UPI000EFB78E0|nr:alkaline phosphatase PafA [Chryseobacterium sp. 6424]AYO57146.1 alkaline phosphatase family protein [Chryseobacterium sp. 6424]